MNSALGGRSFAILQHVVPMTKSMHGMPACISANDTALMQQHNALPSDCNTFTNIFTSEDGNKFVRITPSKIFLIVFASTILRLSRFVLRLYPIAAKGDVAYSHFMTHLFCLRSFPSRLTLWGQR